MPSLVDIVTFTRSARVEEEASAYAATPLWLSSRKCLAMFYVAATTLSAGLPADVPGALNENSVLDGLAAMAIVALAILVWRGHVWAMWLAAAIFIGSKGLAAIEAQAAGSLGFVAVFLASAAYVLTAYALRVEAAREALGPTIPTAPPPLPVVEAPREPPPLPEEEERRGRRRHRQPRRRSPVA